MSPGKARRSFVIAIAILLILGCITLLILHFSQSLPVLSAQKPAVTGENSTKDSISAPSGVLTLPDSSRIYTLHKVSLNWSAAPRNSYKVTMDGDMFFDIPDSPGTFIIYTRLLKLSVTGKSGFRVMAYSNEDGEEVQVLYGHIVAEKRYKSDFPETETLRNNDLLMINSSIDLMEKEADLDTRALRSWKKRVDSSGIKSPAK